VCKNSPVVCEHHLAYRQRSAILHARLAKGPIDSRVGRPRLRDDVFFAASEQAGLPLAKDLVNTAVFKAFLSLFAPVGRSLALATRDPVLRVFPDAIETADG
jgi:hypothetical protein